MAGTWVVDTDMGRDIPAFVQLLWHKSRETPLFDRDNVYVARYSSEGWRRIGSKTKAIDYVSQGVVVDGLRLIQEADIDKLGLITVFDMRTTDVESDDFNDNINTASLFPNASSITPNPAFDRVMVSVAEGTIGSMYAITDVNGRVVLHGEVTSMPLVIDVSTLSRGIYSLNISTTQAGVLFTKASE